MEGLRNDSEHLTIQRENRCAIENLEDVLKLWIRRLLSQTDPRQNGEKIIDKASEIHKMILKSFTDSVQSSSVNRDCNLEISAENKITTIMALNKFEESQNGLDHSTDVCRICLGNSPTHFLFDYYAKEMLNINVMVESVCSVEIPKDDNFPDKICSFCFEDVKLAYSLKKRCQTSDDILKKMKLKVLQEFNNVKEENKECFSEPDSNLVRSEIAQFSHSPQNKVSCLKNEKSACEPLNRTLNNNVKVSRKNKKSESSKAAKKSTPKIERDPVIADKPKSKTEFVKNITKRDGLYRCRFCEYQSKFYSNVRRHMAIHMESVKYDCPRCDRKFERKVSLKIHLVTHTDEKPFLCDLCLYRCWTSTCLRIHKRNKHSHQRNYVCDGCGYAAKSKNTLIVHMKVHTGERNFACDRCSYKAIQLSSLQNHRRMAHTGERPFACGQCPYRSSNVANLRVHAMTHNTIKRFSCDFCPYSCNTKFKLKSHEVIHNGEKPFRCGLCDFQSSHQHSLRRHQKRFHGGVDAKSKVQNN